MASFDAFLEIEGIKGESKDEKHQDEIVIDSFSFGLGSAAPPGAGGGGGAGKVSMQDFHFTMATTKASPVLMQACATGKHFKTATLSVRKAGERQQDFLVIKMNDVLISSYQLGGAASGDALPMDQISLNYSKLEFNYTVGDETTTGVIGGK